MSPIETERLVLREFVESDASEVLAFGSHPLVTRYTHDADLIATMDDALRVIVDTWHADYQKYGYGRLAVVDKDVDRVIGFCGLKYLEDLQATDLGYRLLPEFWGRGLATEAGRAVMDYSREVLNLSGVIGLAVPENIASHRVLEKLGFQKAEQITLDDIEVVQVFREPASSSTSALLKLSTS